MDYYRAFRIETEGIALYYKDLEFHLEHVAP